MKLPKLAIRKEVPVIEQDELFPPQSFRDAYAAAETYDMKRSLCKEFYLTLSRVDLLRFGDCEWYKGHPDNQGVLWEELNDAEWNRDWPLGKSQDEVLTQGAVDAIPITWSKDRKKSYFNLDTTEKAIEGIQAKVDNIMKVLEKFDVTLSAKEAVDLAKK
jgi:hypothetical protein